MKTTYIDHMGSDLTVCNAARISLGKSTAVLSDKDKKLIKYLADNKHMSPFEHCQLTVLIECPLYIRSQIHRHRTFAYNEVSRRYTSEYIQLHVPTVLRKQAKSNRQASEGDLDPVQNEIIATAIMMHNEKALEFYNLLLSKGVCREQARAILPQSMLTKFYMTGNLRNWAHFIELRQHEGAQQEVKEIALQIKSILNTHFPVSLQALLGAV